MSPSLHELESRIPGGLTGSHLVVMTVRGAEQVLECAFEWPSEQVGQPSIHTARLRLTGVTWFDFEPRDPKATRQEPAMRVTSEPLDAAALVALGIPAPPAGMFVHRLFANGTDGALCVVAASAELEWSGA